MTTSSSLLLLCSQSFCVDTEACLGLTFYLHGCFQASVLRVNVGETYAFTWWRQRLNAESKQKNLCRAFNQVECEICFFTLLTVVFQTCVAKKEIVCPLVDKRCNVDIHIMVEGFFFIFSFQSLQMSQDINK